MSERARATNGAVRTSPGFIMPDSPSAVEAREMIASRAYELYEQRGAGSGDALSDWLRAEAELVTMLLQESPKAEESGNRDRVPARTRNTALSGKSTNDARPRASKWLSRKSALKRTQRDVDRSSYPGVFHDPTFCYSQRWKRRTCSQAKTAGVSAEDPGIRKTVVFGEKG